MVKPGDRTKKKKFRKTTKGKSKRVFERGTPGKQSCGLCGKPLHGVPNHKPKSDILKLSKSEKRPTAKHGGVLCGECRRNLAEETAKVVSKAKSVEDVSIKIRKYMVKGEKK